MKHTKADLKAWQSFPLDTKMSMSEQRIVAWFESWYKYTIVNEKTGKTRFVTAAPENPWDYTPKLKKGEYVERCEGGQVYVSFSGGKDSTVLADMCAKVCKRYGWTLYLLFVNTGLEYPEIQKFVKVYAEWLRTTYEIEVVLDIVRPKMRFYEVVKTYGYPVITKEVAKRFTEYKNATPTSLQNTMAYKEFNGIRGKEKGKSFYNKKKYKPILDLDCNLSHKCCVVTKEKPALEYSRMTGRKKITAQMASESLTRKSAWYKNGCNGFDMTEPTSNPMSFWTEQDVLLYIKRFNIPIASVYGDIVFVVEPDQMRIDDYGIYCDVPEKLTTTGCDRTGCIFCAFGCHLEKGESRFERLKRTHPRQYEYCIGGGEYDTDGKWKPNKQGLGMGHVFDELNKIYGDDFIRY